MIDQKELFAKIMQIEQSNLTAEEKAKQRQALMTGGKWASPEKKLQEDGKYNQPSPISNVHNNLSSTTN